MQEIRGEKTEARKAVYALKKHISRVVCEVHNIKPYEHERAVQAWFFS